MSDETEILDYLLLNGALEVVGVDSETGEFLYVFTDKLKKVMPELYQEHIKSVNSEIMRLWEKGLVDIDLMSKDPIVTISKKAVIEEELGNISKEDLWSLNEIKRVLKIQEL
jgi:hypothetical protein